MTDEELLDTLLDALQSRLVPGHERVTRENVLRVLGEVMHQARVSAERAAELQERIRKAVGDLVG